MPIQPVSRHSIQVRLTISSTLASTTNLSSRVTSRFNPNSLLQELCTVKKVYLLQQDGFVHSNGLRWRWESWGPFTSDSSNSTWSCLISSWCKMTIPITTWYEWKSFFVEKIQRYHWRRHPVWFEIPKYTTCHGRGEVRVHHHDVNCCCLRRTSHRFIRTFFVGYGLILSRGAVQNLIRPVYCNTTSKDEFQANVCNRLEDNFAGEARYFTNGMSISDLMGAHVRNNLFTNYRNDGSWSYCECAIVPLNNLCNVPTILSHSFFTQVSMEIGLLDTMSTCITCRRMSKTQSLQAFRKLVSKGHWERWSSSNRAIANIEVSKRATNELMCATARHRKVCWTKQGMLLLCYPVRFGTLLERKRVQRRNGAKLDETTVCRFEDDGLMSNSRCDWHDSWLYPWQYRCGKQCYEEEEDAIFLRNIVDVGDSRSAALSVDRNEWKRIRYFHA